MTCDNMKNCEKNLEYVKNTNQSISNVFHVVKLFDYKY